MIGTAEFSRSSSNIPWLVSIRMATDSAWAWPISITVTRSESEGGLGRRRQNARSRSTQRPRTYPRTKQQLGVTSNRRCGAPVQNAIVTDRGSVSPSLRTLTPGDAGQVVPCLVHAFWDFPEVVHLLPDEGSRRRVLPRYLGSDARDAATFGTLHAAIDEGVVVGAAAWVPPQGYPVSKRRKLAEARHLLPVAPWGFSALREALKGQDANRRRHAGLPPHFWLRAIGVDPSGQGQGIGTLLLRSMLDRADDEGRGAFLFTATTNNVAWYQSFGFKVTSTYHPTPRWPQVWAMRREPDHQRMA